MYGGIFPFGQVAEENTALLINRGGGVGAPFVPGSALRSPSIYTEVLGSSKCNEAYRFFV